MHKLDRFDLRILASLQANGRMKKIDLAEQVGLSTSPCWNRLRRLESLGYIRGYHADVDLKRVVNHEQIIVVVTLKSHESTAFNRFESAILAIPEVVECVAVGGGVDYILRIVARDLAHYQSVMDGLLATEIGISVYFTYAVTKMVKRECVDPVSHLLNRAPAVGV